MTNLGVVGLAISRFAKTTLEAYDKVLTHVIKVAFLTLRLFDRNRV